MSTIPESWILTKIDEIYSVIGGGTPSTNEQKYWNGEIPWITSADITENGKITPRKSITENGIKNSAANLVPTNSLIVVTRVGLGKVALSEFPLCFSQDSQALVGFNDLVYPKYSFYFLLQAVKIFKYQNRGTTISGVTKKQLKDLHFILPPYPEQHRIVAKIEELFTKLDAGVEALKQVQAQLKRYRQSVLKAAVDGRLTAEWREQHKDELEPADKLLERMLKERYEKWETEQLSTYESQSKTPPKNWKDKYKIPLSPETAGLPELPKMWGWVTTEQLTNLVTDGEHITPPRTKNGILLLSARNIQNGYLSFQKVDYVSKETYKRLSKRLRVEYGDVLMSCSGSVGRSCIAPEIPLFCLVRSVAVLKPVLKMGNFLSYCIHSLFLQKQINEKKTQTAQANIFQGKIKQLIFPLVPSLEQKKIVETIDRLFSIVNESELIIDSELKRANSLRQAILKRAFEGKLVPQDSSDEPASVLLERINTEKAKSMKSKQLEML